MPATASRPAKPPAAPTLPPRYRPVERAGVGGIGQVWRVEDANLGRDLAVKLLRRDRRTPEHAARLAREALLTGRLQHPGVPPVVEQGTCADGGPFFAMKLVGGRTLRDLLKEERKASAGASAPRAPDAKVLTVFRQVCDAVGYAHSEGVIHRDLKPSNVMVGGHGEVQVMDWGMARLVRGEVEGAAEESTFLAMAAASPPPLGGADDATALTAAGDDGTVIPPPPGTAAAGGSTDAEAPTLTPGAGSTVPDDPLATMTRAGVGMGTPAYMAPEQARGEPVDARADVFGLGAVLCTVLTGKAPFAGGDAVWAFKKSAAADLADALARLDACDADDELKALCRRCLAPLPAGRPADGTAVADAVRAYEDGVRDRLRRTELAAAAAEVRVAEEKKRRQLRRLLGLVVIFAALLTVGVAGTGWFAREANVQRNRIAIERDEVAAQRDLVQKEMEAAAVAKQEANRQREMAQAAEVYAVRERDQAVMERRAAEAARSRAAKLEAEARERFSDAFEGLAASRARASGATLELAFEQTRRGRRRRADELLGIIGRRRRVMAPAGRTALQGFGTLLDPEPWEVRFVRRASTAARPGATVLRPPAGARRIHLIKMISAGSYVEDRVVLTSAAGQTGRLVVYDSDGRPTRTPETAPHADAGGAFPLPNLFGEPAAVAGGGLSLVDPKESEDLGESPLLVFNKSAVGIWAAAAGSGRTRTLLRAGEANVTAVAAMPGAGTAAGLEDGSVCLIPFGGSASLRLEPPTRLAGVPVRELTLLESSPPSLQLWLYENAEVLRGESDLGNPGFLARRVDLPFSLLRSPWREAYLREPTIQDLGAEGYAFAFVLVRPGQAPQIETAFGVEHGGTEVPLPLGGWAAGTVVPDDPAGGEAPDTTRQIKIAALHQDGTLVLYAAAVEGEPPGGRVIAVIETAGPGGPVAAAAFTTTRDGTLATLHRDGVLRLRRTRAGAAAELGNGAGDETGDAPRELLAAPEVFCEFDLGADAAGAKELALLPDGTLVVLLTDGTARLFGTQPRRPLVAPRPRSPADPDFSPVPQLLGDAPAAP